MNHSYADITSRIITLPKWWDENAVPRYCDFAPREVANIYAKCVALVEIACQSCGQQFPVAFSEGSYDYLRNGDGKKLADKIGDGSLHYGDPPNFGCCAPGPTMSCEDLRVIEYWCRAGKTGPGLEWERDATLEIELPDAMLRTSVDRVPKDQENQ